MITPSHIIYSWALAKKTEASELEDNTSPRRTLAFVLGALFPDTPTYLFFIVCGLILGYSGQEMWGDMYFNSGWSIPITLTHSFILWPILIATASYFGWRFIGWFSMSAFFHSAVDFFVHTDDAYRHFYPFSNWKFHSPISYYNPTEFGQYVSAFDSLLVLVLIVFLYYRYRHTVAHWPRYLLIALGVLYSMKLIAEPLMAYLHHYGT